MKKETPINKLAASLLAASIHNSYDNSMPKDKKIEDKFNTYLHFLGFLEGRDAAHDDLELEAIKKITNWFEAEDKE